MKTVFVVHVMGRAKVVDRVLLPYKYPGEPLTAGDLENIFLAHNAGSVDYHLTGWPDFAGLKDYVVDVDCMDVWSCEPVGWRRVRGAC